MTLHIISEYNLVCRHVAKTEPPAPHCRANGEQLPYLAKHNRLTLLTGAAWEEGLSLENKFTEQFKDKFSIDWANPSDSQTVANIVCEALHRLGLDMLVKPCVATLLQFSDSVREREGNQDYENQIMVYDTKGWNHYTWTLLSQALPVPETSKRIQSSYNCINSHDNYDPSIKMWT